MPKISHLLAIKRNIGDAFHGLQDIPLSKEVIFDIFHHMKSYRDLLILRKNDLTSRLFSITEVPKVPSSANMLFTDWTRFSTRPMHQADVGLKRPIWRHYNCSQILYQIQCPYYTRLG